MPRDPRYAVVMAGGAGTRFWPRSRRRSPKQFLPIVGGRTMLQETVARLSPPIAADRVLIVTERTQAGLVRRQLPGFTGRRVLAEPIGRNTAAAIALAALELVRTAPRAVMAVLPADHAIGRLPTFRADLRAALDLAERTGALVTLGLPPTRPETGYGYIVPGRPIAGAGEGVAWVARFVEKPPRARAARLVTGGRALWNSGIFAWRAADVLAELRRYLPGLVRRLEAALRRGTRTALESAYRSLPSISIDHGVLERSRKVAVVRARFTWSDVGSWAAVEPFWRTGREANAVRGTVVPIESRGCVVDSPQRLVALVGVDDLVVVDTDDALLVCRKDRAQDVRRIVDELRRRGLERYC